MLNQHLQAPCPEHLEDEAFIIETSGEMPEVALAESLLHLGQVGAEDLDCLRAAAARGYLRLIHRDLDPFAVGKAHFRGLERAGENLARLRGFLAKLGWELDAGVVEDLAARLGAYLGAEEKCLDQGRGYATCTRDHVEYLARELALSLGPWRDLLERLALAACPDFRGLAALTKLESPGGAAKRRWEGQGVLVVEVLEGPEGPVLGRATLPLVGPSEQEDPANRARAEMVWALLPLPPA